MVVRSPLEATGLHDSSLDSVQVSILDKSCLIRTVGVCGDLAEGALADIGCHNLESFFMLSDSQELSDNAWPGNIQDGHFDGLGCTGVLRLYLAGGMLEAGGQSTQVGAPCAVWTFSTTQRVRGLWNTTRWSCCRAAEFRCLDGVEPFRRQQAVLSSAVGAEGYRCHLLARRA